jgi:hypothetical protein
MSTTFDIATHDPPETTGAELDSDAGASVVWELSVGVAACSVVVCASWEDEEGPCVCSPLAASPSPELPDEVELAWGARAGALSACVELALCAGAWVALWLDRAALALEPVLFTAVLLCALPGNACAAIAVNAPVSVTLPASSQRLQRASRCRAASRERVAEELVMRTFSTPLPCSH